MKYALSSPVGGHSSRHLVLATKGHPFNNALSHNEPTGQTNRKTPSKKTFRGMNRLFFGPMPADSGQGARAAVFVHCIGHSRMKP